MKRIKVNYLAGGRFFYKNLIINHLKKRESLNRRF